ncbi:MAG: DUF4426 domain-containing protein [Pseudomonadota bacterium]
MNNLTPHSATSQPTHRARTGALLRVCLAATLWCCAIGAQAEQTLQAGAYTVHHIAFTSTFLEPAIARKYDIKRRRNRAVINLSVLDDAGDAHTAEFEGTVTNLPGQVLPLRFKEVRDGEAIYYIAQTVFSDQEILRFNITMNKDGRSYPLKFTQKMYWEN